MLTKSGIILAGGTGSRLAPLNSLFNKHMVPVYNKFIIDYPLDTLRNLGVKNVTVVLGGSHFSQVVSHIKDGSHLGMKVNYVYQDKPIGIAQAINLCERFVCQDDHFVTVLGDNIFENPIKLNTDCTTGAQVILHKHAELNRFGVASIANNKIVKLEEKPLILDPSLDNYAITGCYIFDNQFFRYFSRLQPSARGEYEITDIIRLYNQDHDLGFTFLDGMWSDAGTHESINFVNNFFYQKFHRNSEVF
jgi:glucose-1-phosphate thymidylyltransferase